MTSTSDLIVAPYGLSKPNAHYRLLCFNWAGGGSQFYLSWARIFPSDVEVLAIRPPGRESRIREESYQVPEKFISDATKEIVDKYADKPLALFGHSMGGRIAFAVARQLCKRHSIDVVHLFLSAAWAPHSVEANEAIKTRVPTASATDDEMVKYVQGVGGTPPEVLEHRELLALFLAPLKADLGMLHQYKYTLEDPPPLTCPISVYEGSQDMYHFDEQWPEVTSGIFQKKVFPGGHFYLHEPAMQEQLRDNIVQCLKTAPCQGKLLIWGM